MREGDNVTIPRRGQILRIHGLYQQTAQRDGNQQGHCRHRQLSHQLRGQFGADRERPQAGNRAQAEYRTKEHQVGVEMHPCHYRAVNIDGTHTEDVDDPQ
ncbi:hypothetical protein D3C78_1642850 [compost metagenome]